MECIDSNNIIALNRGDTFTSLLSLNAGTDLNPIPYVLKDEDEVYMGVMEPDQPFENAILKKKFTKDNLKGNDIYIRLEHTDTTCLLPGKYFYQIKLKIKNEDNTYDINTVVPKTEFIILE